MPAEHQRDIAAIIANGQRHSRIGGSDQ